jgi:hypothetical protein
VSTDVIGDFDLTFGPHNLEQLKSIELKIMESKSIRAAQTGTARTSPEQAVCALKKAGR